MSDFDALVESIGSIAESIQDLQWQAGPQYKPVVEAIVNAVAHRDYTRHASVQVMLFADRLEVWNPGEPPPPLTVAELFRPHASIPRNPLIAEPMFLAGYVEKAGSGTLDMIARCREAGLPPPVFRQDGGQFVQVLQRPPDVPAPEVTTEVTTEVNREVNREVAPAHRLALALVGEMTRQQLQVALGLMNDEYFRKAYLQPALDAGLIEMTVPDKPRSSQQKYRLVASKADKNGTKRPRRETGSPGGSL